ncbi:claudin-19-like [Styela clava]
MVISSCQMVGYLAGIGTLVGSIVSTSLPDWKHNNLADEQSFTGASVYRGLWVTCFVRTSGAIECQPLVNPFFVLPTVIRGCRVLIVIASILSFLGVAITPLGMQCTRIGGDRITKSRLARFGAFLFGVAGILAGAAVSWFADDIAKEFDEEEYPGLFGMISNVQFVYGNSLFVGWGTMVVGTLSAIFLTLGSCEPRVGPRMSTPSISSNSSRLLSTNNNGKDRLKSTTPIQRTNKPKQNEYYATTVTNGSAGVGATTGLAVTYSGRSGLVRQASIMSAPPKTTSNGPAQLQQNQSFKTYV